MKTSDDHRKEEPQASSHWTDVLSPFLQLGVFAFGGPAAHIALMEQEFVDRRKWLDKDHFLDLVGVTSLIPGPNSTEMTMHIGYERAGALGLFAAGASFILPTTILTTALAWAYTTYGQVPQVVPFLIGIKAVVLTIMVSAILRLGKRAIKSWRLGFLGVMVLAFSLLGVNELALLFGGGLLGMLWLRVTQGISVTALLSGLILSQGKAAKALVGSKVLTPVSSWKLFWFFLKIGSVLYGSGYVLVAFLDGQLVNELGWLTQAQLLDAVAAGQLAPGPVLSTATFIGFLLGGVKGALAATIGIFLPSFFFVLALNRFVKRLRKSVWLSAFLDSVNIVAVALMLKATLSLGLSVFVSWQAGLIAILAIALQFK